MNEEETKTETPATPEPTNVSATEFKEFQKEVTQGFSAIAEALNNLQPKAPEQVVKSEGGTDEAAPIPAGWRKAVTEILGPDFDCELSQPDAGGTIFRIIVPREKSNAPSIHWQNFKRDVRSKELGNSGKQGVTEWCLRVRANLTKSGVKLPQYP